MKVQDETFWENSKQQNKKGPASIQMVDLLHNLSSLRLSLRQACLLSETLKSAAITAEVKGESMRALELLSETHTAVLKIRATEQRIDEVKLTIMKKQNDQNTAHN